MIIAALLLSTFIGNAPALPPAEDSLCRRFRNYAADVLREAPSPRPPVGACGRNWRVDHFFALAEFGRLVASIGARTALEAQPKSVAQVDPGAVAGLLQTLRSAPDLSPAVRAMLADVEVALVDGREYCAGTDEVKAARSAQDPGYVSFCLPDHVSPAHTWRGTSLIVLDGDVVQTGLSSAELSIILAHEIAHVIEDRVGTTAAVDKECAHVGVDAIAATLLGRAGLPLDGPGFLATPWGKRTAGVPAACAGKPRAWYLRNCWAR